jgi:hypothetical protein
MTTVLLNTLTAVLYELQPIRLKDAIALSKWVHKNAVQVVSAFRDLFLWLWGQVLSLKLMVCSVERQTRKVIAIGSLTLLIWILGLLLFIRIGFAAVFCILSGIVLIFANLGDRKKGEMSAYSVFNNNFHRLLGTLTAEQFDREIRHNNTPDDDDGDQHDDAEFYFDANGGRHHRQRGHNEDLAHRKVSGKKARRGYEKKLQRRQLEKSQRHDEVEEDFLDEDRFIE